MNNESYFSLNPTRLDLSRSIFDRPYNHKTTFDSGKLVPLYVDEVLPGDSVSMPIDFVLRSLTPVNPVMDVAYFDINAYFIPNRLVYEHWEELNGQNDTTAWTQTTEYQVPQCEIGYLKKSDLGAYILGLPTSNDDDTQGSYSPVSAFEHKTVSALYRRAYWKVVNDWWRDENIEAPHLFSVGDDASSETYAEDLFNVNKFHDYFTSCLPGPQKGPDVSLTVLDPDTVIPVYPRKELADYTPGSDADVLGFKVYNNMYREPTSTNWTDMRNLMVSTLGTLHASTDIPSGSYNNGITSPYPNNLGVGGSDFKAISVNDLRLAFQVQKLYERDARGGTRYISVLKSHFGVVSPDARLQRSEWLGGKRIPINMDTVLDTSSAGLGDTGAFSNTVDSSHLFTKSFVEHGILLIVGCVRTNQTYSQGLNRIFTRKDRLDFYWPVLANIGEQPVMKSELVLGAYSDVDTGVFGYQEAWAEYRYKPNSMSGYLNPASRDSLKTWSYGQEFPFDESPVLNKDFLQQDESSVGQTLIVGEMAHQFFGDFQFSGKWSRVMPVYSVPGLIDHH